LEKQDTVLDFMFVNFYVRWNFTISFLG